MSVVKFDQLSEKARLWIFASERKLTDAEVRNLDDRMQRFMANWTAHKKELITGWKLAYNQFIMLGVDESLMAASGCSIDSLVHHLKEFEQKVACGIVNTHALIFYLDENQTVRCVDRSAFKQLVEADSVNEETIVFNNTIQTIRELRSGKWQVPIRDSWHMQAFGVLV